MKAFVIIIISLLIYGCASKQYSDDVLDNAFEGYVGDLSFHIGSWAYPKQQAGYFIRGSNFYFAELDAQGEVVSYKISVEGCASFYNEVEKLKKLVFVAVKQGYGEMPIKEPEIMVTDGNAYTIKFYSKKINSHIALEAGEVARLYSSWVEVAVELKAIADNCNKKQNVRWNSDGVLIIL